MSRLTSSEGSLAPSRQGWIYRSRNARIRDAPARAKVRTRRRHGQMEGFRIADNPGAIWKKELVGDTLGRRRRESVDRRTFLSVAGVCLAVTVASGQQSDRGRIFTSAQTVAGRVAYEKSCGRCHTLTLMGRQGKEIGREN